MTSYKLTGVAGAKLDAKRTTFTIELKTNSGPVALEVPTEQLDRLISSLETLERGAATNDPIKGMQPNELMPLRYDVVQKVIGATADRDGRKLVILGLRTNEISRFFGFDERRLEELEAYLARAKSTPPPKMQ